LNSGLLVCGLVFFAAAIIILAATTAGDDGFHLNFNTPFWIEQGGDNHRARWTDRAKELAMNAAHGLPILGMSQEHTRPNNILELSASLGKRCGGQFENTASLPGNIQIVGAGRPGSREMNDIAHTHGA